MYIKRNIEDKIIKYLKSPEITAIVGPRQCGKTTLLRRLHENFGSESLFLTFEDRRNLELFNQDIELFIKSHINRFRYVFIDEFQYAKNGGKRLKYIYDKTAGKCKLFISGSSSIDLTVQAVKHLTGRIFIFNLYPFDFFEFLQARDPSLALFCKENALDLNKAYFNSKTPASSTESLKQYFADYATYGGYPRVAIANDNEEKKEVLKNIFNTYFLREVKDILGLTDDYKLSKMIKALALQIGNLVEYAEICSFSDLTYPTLKKHLNFLEKTFICRLIQPFFTNKRKEIVKNPKIFFFDNGLRNHVVNDFRPLVSRPDAGALLENAVAMQIIKKELPLNYWRTKQKQEIDFVVDLPEGKKIALEIKKTLGNREAGKSAMAFAAQHPGIPLFYLYLEAGNGISDASSAPVFLV